MKRLTYIALVLIIGVLSSCNGPVSKNELYKYLADDTNGAFVSKKVNGFVLGVKFLPPELLTLNELESDETINVDTVYNQYNNGLHFLFSIEVDPQIHGDQDLFAIGIKEFEEYDTRERAFSHELSQHVSLRFGAKEQAPVLSVLNTNRGTGNKKTILITFEKKYDEEKMVFEFRDPFFKTGTTKFKFDKKNLENIPQLQELALN